jgi:hypothetical protein
MDARLDAAMKLSRDADDFKKSHTAIPGRHRSPRSVEGAMVGLRYRENLAADRANRGRHSSLIQGVSLSFSSFAI